LPKPPGISRYKRMSIIACFALEGPCSRAQKPYQGGITSRPVAWASVDYTEPIRSASYFFAISQITDANQMKVLASERWEP